MALPVTFDHCVVHVSDWERSNAFYRDVLGAELVRRPQGWAYRFGAAQLNLHGPGFHPAEVARLPVQPGNSDLCFEWNGPIADAIDHLRAAASRSMPDRSSASGKGGHASISAIPTARCSSSFPMLRLEAARDDPAQPQHLACRSSSPARRRRRASSRRPEAAGARARGNGWIARRSAQAARPHGGLRLSSHRCAGAGVARRLGPDPARAATPQSCAFRETISPSSSGSAWRSLYGLSTQDTGYQSEAVERLHLPFPLLSDQKLELARALDLPTFTVAGMTLLKRMAWVIDDGAITKVFYPVPLTRTPRR